VYLASINLLYFDIYILFHEKMAAKSDIFTTRETYNAIRVTYPRIPDDSDWDNAVVPTCPGCTDLSRIMNRHLAGCMQFESYHFEDTFNPKFPHCYGCRKMSPNRRDHVSFRGCLFGAGTFSTPNPNYPLCGGCQRGLGESSDTRAHISWNGCLRDDPTFYYMIPDVIPVSPVNINPPMPPPSPEKIIYHNEDTDEVDSDHSEYDHTAIQVPIIRSHRITRPTRPKYMDSSDSDNYGPCDTSEDISDIFWFRPSGGSCDSSTSWLPGVTDPGPCDSTSHIRHSHPASNSCKDETLDVYIPNY
jgi:hypothetical protein